MASVWLLMAAFVPAMVFWIILKVLRIEFYMYKRRHYPKEYDRLGYSAMGVTYIRDIFSRSHIGDRRYRQLVRYNRTALLLFACIFIMTAYIVYLYLS
jgi:hypothetical protein